MSRATDGEIEDLVGLSECGVARWKVAELGLEPRMSQATLLTGSTALRPVPAPARVLIS